MAESLDAARKLNWYSPFMVPFNFSSPFAAGGLWFGCSRRTFERAACRPPVKPYLAPGNLEQAAPDSRLVHPARLPREAGRIEFKAFDAMPGVDQLTACCHLLEGVWRAPDLPGRSEQADLASYRRAAPAGFDDPRPRGARVAPPGEAIHPRPHPRPLSRIGADAGNKSRVTQIEIRP